jgi:hypothetical protein
MSFLPHPHDCTSKGIYGKQIKLQLQFYRPTGCAISEHLNLHQDQCKDLNESQPKIYVSGLPG